MVSCLGAPLRPWQPVAAMPSPGRPISGPPGRSVGSLGLQRACASPMAPPPRPAGEPDFSQKHPLETKWTLWFDNPNGKQKQATWGQTLRAVYTFDTVEDFWW